MRYSSKCRNTGLRASQNQRMDVVRPLQRIHGLEVEHMPDHMELIRDAVATVNVSGGARNIQCLASAVALGH